MSRSGKIKRIKLPRDIVKGCDRPCRRSKSFSQDENLVGKTVIIYCTDDQKNITDTFTGVVQRVSRRASRLWVLKNAIKL